MQRLRNHKLLTATLCSLAIGYLLCLSVFTHYHVVNNTLVAHAHPFSQQTHNSNAEIWLLHQASSFDSDALYSPCLFVAYTKLISCFLIARTVETPQTDVFNLLPSRAPPVL